jgi:aminoglycoside 2'-N-acetyltransferase I
MTGRPVVQITCRVAHSADIPPAVLNEVRTLLTTAFDREFDDADWDHTLGGMHVIARQVPDGGAEPAAEATEHTRRPAARPLGSGASRATSPGGSVVGHASVVQRRLVVGGRSLRTGYVEGVGVHPDWQRRGIGDELMTALEPIIRAAYDLGALGATEDGARLYTRHGWRPWRGPLSVMTPTGTVSTPEERGWVHVLTDEPLDLDAELTCDWRDGDAW